MKKVKGKLAIIHNLPTGGGYKLKNWIIKMLHKNGWAIDIYSSNQQHFNPRSFTGSSRAHITKRTVEWMKQAHYSRNIYSFFRYVYNIAPHGYQNLAKQIQKRGYDCILVFSDWALGAPPLFRWLNAPSIYIAFEPKREYIESTRWPSFLNRSKSLIWQHITKHIKQEDFLNTRRAKTTYTISAFANDVLQHYYQLQPEQIAWEYPGLYQPEYRTERSRTCTNNEKYDAMSIGALTFLKGYDFIIKALGRTRFAKRSKYLVIGNGGKDIKNIQVLARRHKINITIKQNVPNEYLRCILSKTPLFLYAPRNEPFGLSLLEAVTLGSFPITVNEGGPGEIATLLHLPTIPRQEQMFALAIDYYAKQSYRWHTPSDEITKTFKLRRYINKLEVLIKHATT